MNTVRTTAMHVPFFAVLVDRPIVQQHRPHDTRSYRLFWALMSVKPQTYGTRTGAAVIEHNPLSYSKLQGIMEGHI